LRTWRSIEEGLVNRGLDPNLARDLLWTAVQAEELAVERDAPMVEDQMLSGEIPDDRILSVVEAAFGTKLVITSPVTGEQESVPPTLRAFRLLIAASNRILLIASPYIDKAGVDKLEKPLRAAIERGVSIYLLTREVALRHPSRTAGLRALFEIAQQNLHVKDYHTKSRNRAHITSLHAKLLQADRNIGFVGSAELRGNALEKNFEMGAIIRGEEALQAAEAFQAVWKAAAAVDLAKVTQ